MKYQWRKQAETQMAKEVRYCQQHFGARVAMRFIESVDKQVKLLGLQPYMGKIEPLLIDRKRHQYRSLVIHEHFKLIHYIDQPNDTLYIADLWDTRREPSRLTKEARK